MFLPRALPWAGMLRPFRAKKCTKVISEKEFTKVLIPPLRGVKWG